MLSNRTRSGTRGSRWFRAFYAAIFLVVGSECADAQALSFGSDGSDGAFVFVQDTGPTALPSTMRVDLGLAASGLDGQGQPITCATPSPVADSGVYDAAAWAVVFKYSSVTVPYPKQVRFKNHPAQAPVVWLVQGTADIQGKIDVGATWFSLNSENSGQSLEPGPGGFRGGAYSALTTPESQYAGFGPGGGSVPVYPRMRATSSRGITEGLRPARYSALPTGRRRRFPSGVELVRHPPTDHGGYHRARWRTRGRHVPPGREHLDRSRGNASIQADGGFVTCRGNAPACLAPAHDPVDD